MRAIVLVGVLVGCEKQAAPPPPHHEVAPAVARPPREVPIERVRGLALEPYSRAQRPECQPSAVARRRFAGAMVEPCGTFDIVSDADWEQALDNKAVSRKLRPAVDCAAAAIAQQRPFIVEQQVAGTDSAVARGLVGVLENGKLAVYGVSYDSNPCGGGCPERGHTTVVRCADVAKPPSSACFEISDCFHCLQDTPVVEECVYGGPPPN